jgi:hypothetical protein
MKIEEGCLAIVVDDVYGDDPMNIGKVVTVGSPITTLSGVEVDGFWHVDKPMGTKSGLYICAQHVRNLDRLL